MEINSELLRDLVALLQRYPKEQWLQLSEILENETLRLRLVASIKHLAEISASLPRATGKNRARKGRGGVHLSPLMQLKRQDPAKFQLLNRVRQKLISRELLSSASELRMFGEKLGVAVPNDIKREQAISLLLRLLIPMTGEEIAQRLGLGGDAHISPSGNSYDQWVEVIMGKNRAKN